jgi:glutamate:GABA antiporter
MPAYRVLTVVLMILVAVATVQLIAPGLGSSWFGSDFIPEGWTYAQRLTYLWTELIPGADLHSHRHAVLVDGPADPG